MIRPALVCLIASVLFLGGCLEQRSAEDRERRLVYGFSEPFFTFDPARQRFANESAIMQNVVETLTRWGRDLELEPRLALYWETPDECGTWTFHLREGVTFHDGTPFNSEAVKFNIERILAPETAASRAHLIRDIEQIETPDPHTVVFRLSSPNCILPERLTSTFTAIVSPTAIENYGTRIGRNPAGTGPFMLERWSEADNSLLLRRNPDHWAAHEFFIEEIEMRQIQEHTTRLILLEQGVLDMAPISADHVVVARESDHIRLESIPRLQIIYIGFNTQFPPFDDVRMRQAANYAVNTQDIIDHVFFGVGVPAVGPIPESLPAFNDELAPYGYDPARARELMAEAGYPDGVDVVFWTQDAGAYNRVSQAVVEQLRRVGIRAELNVLDSGVYWSKFDEFRPPTGERFPTKDGVYQMYVGGWTGGEAAHGFLESLFKGDSASNSSFYDNPEVNRLLDEYKFFPKTGDRNEIYRELQRIILADAPWIFTFFPHENMGIQPHVRNFQVHPSGMLWFNNVRLSLEEPAELEASGK